MKRTEKAYEKSFADCSNPDITEEETPSMETKSKEFVKKGAEDYAKV